MDFLTVCGFIGVLAALYAIYVEDRSEHVVGYVPMCEIGPNASCTMVLKSDYARMAIKYLHLDDNSMFNVPNTYYGLLFYVAVMLYGCYPFTLIPYRETMLLIAASGSMLMSAVLAYILKYVLKNFCAICVFTYVVNTAIFCAALYE